MILGSSIFAAIVSSPFSLDGAVVTPRHQPPVFNPNPMRFFAASGETFEPPVQWTDRAADGAYTPMPSVPLVRKTSRDNGVPTILPVKSVRYLTVDRQIFSDN